MPPSRPPGRLHASADPVPLPRAPKKAQPHPSRTTSHDSADAARRRVCRACDRCRLKKSKCDGSSPCSRCGDDNTICIYGDRKQSHDKIYPAGYTGHLERDQVKLVSAIQKMYRMLQDAQAWPGPALVERAGRPLTHDLLIELGILTNKDDGPGDLEYFEENHENLKAKLLSGGAGYVQRRPSSSAASDHSSRDVTQSTTPVLGPAAKDPKPPTFKDNFNFGSASPSSFSRPQDQQRDQSFSAPQSFGSASPASFSKPPIPQRDQAFPAPRSQPLQQPSPFVNDPQFYAAEWAIPDMSTSQQTLLHSNYAMQPQTMQSHTMQPEAATHIHNNNTFVNIDGPMTWNTNTFGVNSMMGGLEQQLPNATNPGDMDWSGFDPSELEFHKYVQDIQPVQVNN